MLNDFMESTVMIGDVQGLDITVVDSPVEPVEVVQENHRLEEDEKNLEEIHKVQEDKENLKEIQENPIQETQEPKEDEGENIIQTTIIQDSSKPEINMAHMSSLCQSIQDSDSLPMIEMNPIPTNQKEKEKEIQEKQEPLKLKTRMKRVGLQRKRKAPVDVSEGSSTTKDVSLQSNANSNPLEPIKEFEKE